MPKAAVECKSRQATEDWLHTESLGWAGICRNRRFKDANERMHSYPVSSFTMNNEVGTEEDGAAGEDINHDHSLYSIIS